MAIRKAREIAELGKEELWGLPDTSMKLEFDDGVLETNARATIFSAYIFGPFYRQYPQCPALKRHHICSNQLGANTTLDLMGKVLFDAYDATPGVDIEDMMLLVTRLNNAIYNDFTYRLEEYVGSLNILDILQVIDHPEISRINRELQPTEASINRSYDEITEILNKSKDLAKNPISKATRSGLVSMGQVLQVVGPRGRCTDTDSNIFRTPVMHGYAHGIQSLAESMIESRSAAKALMFTKDPLQESQYTNRKIQLLGGSLMNLHPGDCGGGRLIPLRLQGRDMALFAGKMYIPDNDLTQRMQYSILRESDKHLIGEMIHVRTIFGCKHPDPQGVCAACYGEMSLSIPKGTIIGHIAATVMCEAISQILLSTKHLDSSASQEGSILSDYDMNYMEENVEANTLRLSHKLENAQVSMVILAKEATHINDVTIVDDVSVLPTAGISALTDIKLEIVTPSVNEAVVIHVSDEARKSYLTTEMLAHIKKVSWTLTASGDYRIDLTSWNNAEPVLELPLKQTNMLDYMYTIEKFLRSSDKGKKVPTLRSYNTPEAGLMKLYELVSSRLKFNIVHLECLVMACMIRSSAHRDYRIPLAGNATEFGRYGDIMAMRSLGAAMAFESHNKVLLNPYAFVVKDRNDHPLDALLRG
jgi:hypothetical protein